MFHSLDPGLYLACVRNPASALQHIATQHHGPHTHSQIANTMTMPRAVCWNGSLTLQEVDSTILFRAGGLPEFDYDRVIARVGSAGESHQFHDDPPWA